MLQLDDDEVGFMPRGLGERRRTILESLRRICRQEAEVFVASSGEKSVTAALNTRNGEHKCHCLNQPIPTLPPQPYLSQLVVELHTNIEKKRVMKFVDWGLGSTHVHFR